MRGYVELTNQGTRVMLPVGRFEVWEARSGAATIQPCSCRGESDCNEMDWVCEEPYEKVKALIAAAQEQEPVKRFICLTEEGGRKRLINISDIDTVRETLDTDFTMVWRVQNQDGKSGFVVVKESVEEVNRLIMEAQEDVVYEGIR